MLKAEDESLLRFQFGRQESLQGGSIQGALLERHALYKLPKPAPKRTKGGKLIRDEALIAAQLQWQHVRRALERYAVGKATLVALFGYLPTEMPWRTGEPGDALHETLPRVAAAYAEIDRLFAVWQAGTLPNEAALRRWIVNEALPIRAGKGTPEITAKPTAETRTINATVPAHRDLLRAAAAGRILQRMGRAGRIREVDALRTLYGAPGEHFMDYGLPRHWALASMVSEDGKHVMIEAGALLAKLPRDARPLSHLSWANLWAARDQVTYAAFAEDFDALETACGRLEARACRAWEVAKERTATDQEGVQ